MMPDSNVSNSLDVQQTEDFTLPTAPLIMQLEYGKQKKFSGNGMNLPSLGSFLLFVLANTVRRELLNVHRDKKSPASL